MTLLETQRLVRKISELLAQTGGGDAAPKLAGDYAAACRAVNLRLQQCEAMIKAGDRHQAIQLAETAPNLLDLVTALEFHGADEWRAYCQQNSLPAADRIDAPSVRALNEAYAQGITTDHPLYAAYRRAVLSRNDEEALKTLQSITRLNAADANAAAELARLDTKVLGARTKRLEALLDRGEPAVLIAEVEAIEAFGFKSKPEGEAWRKAQVIRCENLVEEAARLKISSQWAEALARLDFVNRLRDEFKLELRDGLLNQIVALESWGRVERDKDAKDQEFKALLAELHFRIHQSEEKDTSARYVKLPELRSDYEGLHRTWRSLADFTRPIPEDATAGFRKRSGLLEAEIARRTAIRWRLVFAGSAAILVAGALIVWAVVAQTRARDLARQLQESVAQRQVHAAERLLQLAQAGQGRLIGAATVGAAAANAEAFVSREHALLANFETAFNALPPQLTSDPDAAGLSKIAGQLDLARSALSALAPDVRGENEPRLAAFEKRWQDYLATSGAAVNTLVDRWVSAAEKQAEGLDYRAPVDQAAARIAALGILVRKIADAEAGFTNHLKLRGDLLLRSAGVRAKFTAYAGELEKIDQGMAALRRAHTTADFSAGIALMASSEFSTSPAAGAAAFVLSLNASNESVQRLLLNATNAGTWNYLTKSKSRDFIPEIAMPTERRIFQLLRNDPAVAGIHQRYRLWLDSDGKNKVEWITAGVLEPSPGWRKIKVWAPSNQAVSAVFEFHDYGFFDGRYRLSATEPVYKVETIGDANETAVFGTVGLDKVWTAGETYDKSLLEVLDAIKNSRDGSPLFRAYLILHLIGLMHLQPDAWGLNFCPALRADESQIRAIVGSPFESGDWYVPAKINAFALTMEHFLTSVKDVSYAKQAVGLLALERAVARDGLQYAGFIGLDGKPNYADNSATGEVWGYSAAWKQPTLMVVKIDKDQPLKEPPIPLSPLFALPHSAREYLSGAGVEPEDRSFRVALPPLFRQPLSR